jgi:apolipoprotein N-acyltransferase
MSVVSATSLVPPRTRLAAITSSVRVDAPTLTEWVASVVSALLLILSFPNFEFTALAWIGLVPLIVAVGRRPSPPRALILGWTTGTLFFYVTCYWLTYSMIHYGGLPAVVAYLLLIPGAIVVGLFPGLFAMVLAVVVRRWGRRAVLLSPIIWATFEYARLGVTGQLWNAIGYSQAYLLSGMLIQVAKWGGVYEVGGLVVAVNAAVALIALDRTWKSIGLTSAVGVLVILMLVASLMIGGSTKSGFPPFAHVIAVQPNVPMTLFKPAEENQQLLQRHLTLTANALGQLPSDDLPRLVVWPESPMNFAYGSDQQLQQILQTFARQNRVSLLLNSQEAAPLGGIYNSAILLNEDGRMISQYDKIRLLPFGEYVPLPRWLPGASLITAIVGDFTPGANYTMMPVRDHRVGVFICIESAYPSIARTLTNGGADALINISNDGYLGPTAVMRQHLANAVFRAVENGRPVIRVTNTGITALIRADGYIQDQTQGYQETVRPWMISEAASVDTFYSKYGDVFVQTCSVVTLLLLIVSIVHKRRGFEHTK